MAREGDRAAAGTPRGRASWTLRGALGLGVLLILPLASWPASPGRAAEIARPTATSSPSRGAQPLAAVLAPAREAPPSPPEVGRLAGGPASGPDASPAPDPVRAGLRGFLAEQGRPIPGLVEFVAGPNRGERIQVDATGAFEAGGLLPGRARLRISGPRGLWVEQAHVLLPAEVLALRIEFVRGSVLRGTIQDELGRPVPGATVSLHGQSVLSDHEGGFRLPHVVSGSSLVLVEHPDHALACRRIRGAWTGPPAPPLCIRLRPAAALRLDVPPARDDRPVHVSLRPGSGAPGGSLRCRTSAYPWALVEPIQIRPGEGTTLHGLPPGPLEIRATHPSGTARSVRVRLQSGRLSSRSLRVEPASEHVRGT